MSIVAQARTKEGMSMRINEKENQVTVYWTENDTLTSISTTSFAYAQYLLLKGYILVNVERFQGNCETIYYFVGALGSITFKQQKDKTGNKASWDKLARIFRSFRKEDAKNRVQGKASPTPKSPLPSLEKATKGRG